MKRIQNNVLVAIALLLGAFQVEAQEHSFTDEERQAKLDSIIAETERHFGWNDDAYSVKTAKEMWLSGDAKLLLQGGIAPLAYVGQEKFAKKYSVDYDDFGCIANCSDAQMAKYNTAIIDCLTAKFGKGWRDSIRKDTEYRFSITYNMKEMEPQRLFCLSFTRLWADQHQTPKNPDSSGILLTAFRRRQWNFCIEESNTMFRWHAMPTE